MFARPFFIHPIKSHSSTKNIPKFAKSYNTSILLQIDAGRPIRFLYAPN